MEYFIWQYSLIPQTFFSKNNITYPRQIKSDVSTFQEELCADYNRIAIWLLYKICNYTWLNPQHAGCELFADKSRIYFEIAKELWLYDSDLREYYKSPGQIWFLIEQEAFPMLLKNSNLFGTAQIKSKRERYIEMSSGVRLIDEIDDFSYKTLNHNSDTYTETHCEVLIQHAVIMSYRNKNFRRKFQYLCRQLRRNERATLDLQAPYEYFNSSGKLVTGKALGKLKRLRS